MQIEQTNDPMWWNISSFPYNEQVRAYFNAVPGIVWNRMRNQYEVHDDVVPLAKRALENAFRKKVKAVPLPIFSAEEHEALWKRLSEEEEEGLHRHQEQFIASLFTHTAKLAAHPMGAGKTRSALTAIKLLREEKLAIIIGPASAREVWRDQGEKWIGEEVFFVGSAKDAKSAPETGIIATSFQLVKHLKHLDPHIVVIDEIHLLKNTKTTIFKSAKALTDKALYRIGLTGTAIPNHTWELHAIYELLSPGSTQSYWKWTQRYSGGDYEEILDRKCWVTKALDEVPPEEMESTFNLAELKERFYRFAHVVEVAEVKKALPPIHISHKPIKVDGDEYAKVRALEARLPVDRHARAKFIAYTHELKLDAIVEKLQSSKVNVLMTHRKALLAMVEERLPRTTIVLTGSQAPAQRAKRIRKAREAVKQGEEITLLCTIDAMQVAIDLSFVNHFVYGELTPVPGRMAQSVDRGHRLGLVGDFYVDIISVADTLDERVAELLEAKLNLQAGILPDRTNANEAVDALRGNTAEALSVLLERFADDDEEDGED